MERRDGLLKVARLMTIVDVTKLLGVSRPTIYRWLRDPAMQFPKPVHIGKRVGWREEDIENWIETIRGA